MVDDTSDTRSGALPAAVCNTRQHSGTNAAAVSNQQQLPVSIRLNSTSDGVSSVPLNPSLGAYAAAELGQAAP